MGLKYKLHIPALLAILLFALTIHVYWTDNMIQRHKETVIHNQQMILKSIQLELSRNFIAGDLAVVYELLDGLKEIHKESWTNLQFKNAQGKQIYPLSDEVLHDLPHTEPEIVEIKFAVTWGNDVLGTLTLDINWEKYEASQLERIRQLEIYAVIIMVLYFLGGIIWNHLIVIRPLSNIKEAIKGLKSGELKTELLTKRNDELGLLSNAFSEMYQQQINNQEHLNHALTSIWEKEIRHRTVMDNMLDGLVTINKEGQIDSVNKATEYLFGYSSQELLGKNINLLMPEKHARNHNAYLAKHKPGVKSHVVNLYREVYGRRKDGTCFPMEVSVNEVIIKKEKYFVGILRDITERKKTEESLSQFKTSLDLTKDCVFMFWPDTLMFFYANQGAIEQIGYSIDEIIEMKVLDIKPDIEKETFLKIISPLIDNKQQQTSITFETNHQHKMGKHIPVEIFLQYISPEGEPARFIAVVRDITDRISEEKEKEHLRTQLQQAQKMESIGQLTGGIAHDFNNMLASIIGYTDLALERFVTEEGKLSTYLHEVKYAGERGRNLVAQLLAFSRMSPNEPEFLSVQLSVKEALNMLRSIIPSNIDVRLQCDDELPKVFMDLTHLNQIIMNLCINARDSITTDRVGNININIFKQDYVNYKCNSCYEDINGSFIEVSISDTGRGMSPAVMEKIFEPFYTTKDVDKGTGMGLSMVHGIIHEHGGHILVESTINKGTVFHVLLPFNENYIEAGNIKNINTIEQTGQINNSANILVVDDDKSVGLFLAELLEMKGYNVTYESVSEIALNLLHDNPKKFDLLITDQAMPSMTGIQLTKKLRKLLPELPVILCTGYSENLDEESAKQQGVTGYLTKPIDANQLCTLLKESLT